jgi:cytochrome c biogenesis protein CcdA
MDEQRATYVSALAYTSLSLLGVLAFLAATTLRGDYDWVARLGGAGWVFLLSMVILMPTVTPWLKKRLGGRQG